MKAILEEVAIGIIRKRGVWGIKVGLIGPIPGKGHLDIKVVESQKAINQEAVIRLCMAHYRN